MIVAMIPARLHSQRLPKKVLRLLNGKPLLAYIIESARSAKCFDEIVVNTNAPEIEALAVELGCKVYRRPDRLARNNTLADDLVYDFLVNNSCDYMVLLCPTVPFLPSSEIARFTTLLTEQAFTTLISCISYQDQCIYQARFINQDDTGPCLNGQDLEAVFLLQGGIYGWDAPSFVERYQNDHPAWHDYSWKRNLVALDYWPVIDIDTEEDFQLAEHIMRNTKPYSPKYWESEV